MIKCMKTFMMIFFVVDLVVAVIDLIKGMWKYGVIQLTLNCLNPVIIVEFCKKKFYYVYGGTDFQFIIAGLREGQRESYIILAIYAVLMVLIVFSIVKWSSQPKYKKHSVKVHE